MKHTYCMFPFNVKFKNRQNKSIGTEVGIMIIQRAGGGIIDWEEALPSGIIDSALYLGGDYTGVDI